MGFSGTPTVVCRRTREISLVGKEFSILTHWSRDQLLSQKTFIYELMDNASAVDYWEKNFSHCVRQFPAERHDDVQFDESQWETRAVCVFVLRSRGIFLMCRWRSPEIFCDCRCCEWICAMYVFLLTIIVLYQIPARVMHRSCTQRDSPMYQCHSIIS